MNKEKPTPDSVDLSLEEKLNEITRQIEKIIDSHSTILNPEPLQNLIVQLKEQVSDVVAVEEKMNSIRREITEPVKSEIEKTSKLGKFSFWGFWVGFIGGLFAIISIITSLYIHIESTKQIRSLSSKFEIARNEQSNDSAYASTSSTTRSLSNSHSSSDSFSNNSIPHFQADNLLDPPGFPPSPVLETTSLMIQLGESYSHITGFEILLIEFNSDGTVDLAINEGMTSVDRIMSSLDPYYFQGVKYIRNAKEGKLLTFSYVDGDYDVFLKRITIESNSIEIAVTKKG